MSRFSAIVRQPEWRAHDECLQGDLHEHVKTNFPFLSPYHEHRTLQDPAGGSPCAKNSVAFPFSHLSCFSQRNEVAMALGQIYL